MWEEQLILNIFFSFTGDKMKYSSLHIVLMLVVFSLQGMCKRKNDQTEIRTNSNSGVMTSKLNFVEDVNDHPLTSTAIVVNSIVGAIPRYFKLFF